MLKFFVALGVCMNLFFYSYADQLAYITQEQAQRATTFLRGQEQIIIWCGCCEGKNTKELIRVREVYFQHTGYENYYQVVVEGVNNTNEKVKEHLDLAYTFFIDGGMGFCVGTYLKYECDPCAPPFKWDATKRTYNSSKTEKYSGEYSKNSSTSIKSLNIEFTNSHNFNFKISIGTQSGCTGTIEGAAVITKKRNTIVGEWSGENCGKLYFKFINGEIHLTEDNCTFWHGTACSFEGKYMKK